MANFPCEIRVNVYTFVALNSPDKPLLACRRIIDQAVDQKAAIPDYAQVVKLVDTLL